MLINVIKFGGTSVASDESRLTVVKHVKEALVKGYKVALVVSAIGRKGDPYATDTLLSLLPEHTPHQAAERDLLMSCGETISVSVMTALLKDQGVKALPMMGFQAGIITDDLSGNANVIRVKSDGMLKAFETHDVLVVTGFQGITEDGLITTLGRGGSDYTASVLGVALDAAQIEIFTDVDGVMTADPRKVEEARLLDQLSHDALYHMAKSGASVVDHKAIDLAMRAKKDLVVRNTFSMKEGTYVGQLAYDRTGHFITSGPVFAAVASKDHLNLLRVTLPHAEGKNVHHLIGLLGTHGLHLDLMRLYTQHMTGIVHQNDVGALMRLMDHHEWSYRVTPDLVKISGIGSGLKDYPNLLKSVLKALTEADIEIFHSSMSESIVSVLVTNDDTQRTLNVLHRYYKLA